MKEVQRLQEVVNTLRSACGCPWDREQTHESLKPACIEEAAEVINGINILTKTGKSENLKEELGDLLLQVIFHCSLAEEEGLFTLEEVAKVSADKMIRRHPHVFHQPMKDVNGDDITDWSEIKRLEKQGREWEDSYLPEALEEAEGLIQKARDKKGIS